MTWFSESHAETGVRWWHAFGGFDAHEQWVLVVIHASTLAPFDVVNGETSVSESTWPSPHPSDDREFPYLTSWDHVPTDEEKAALTPPSHRTIETNPFVADVTAFHEKFGGFTSDTPNLNVPEPIVSNRIRLLREEVGEMLGAMVNNDLVEIADGAADAIYVIIGACIEYGIPLEKVWAEVQRSNMAKEGHDETGKVAKPEGWTPPDIRGVLGIPIEGIWV